MEINWQAQLGQDRFVVDALGAKRNGTYIDIGAGDPIDISNTYVLEREFGWKGLLCEKDPVLRADILAKRQGNYVVEDARTSHWPSLFDMFAVNGWIDYLSLDLEPPELTLEVLRAIPFDQFRFRIATIEHDLYRQGHRRMVEMASIMYANGYQYVGTAGLKVDGGSCDIEDWWIHEDSGITFDPSTLKDAHES
jgi:hypothetical protein